MLSHSEKEVSIPFLVMKGRSESRIKKIDTKVFLPCFRFVFPLLRYTLSLDWGNTSFNGASSPKEIVEKPDFPCVATGRLKTYSSEERLVIKIGKLKLPPEEMTVARISNIIIIYFIYICYYFYLIFFIINKFYRNFIFSVYTKASTQSL